MSREFAGTPVNAAMVSWGVLCLLWFRGEYYVLVKSLLVACEHHAVSASGEDDDKYPSIYLCPVKSSVNGPAMPCYSPQDGVLRRAGAAACAGIKCPCACVVFVTAIKWRAAFSHFHMHILHFR